MSVKTGSLDLMETKSEIRAKRMSKFKSILIVVLVIIIIIMAIKIGISSDNRSNDEKITDDCSRPLPPDPNPNEEKEKGEKMCMNKNCINTVNELLKKMNMEADPCEDFNEFACGKFLREFVIPPENSKWDSFTPLTDIILDRSKTILEEEESDEDWPIFKKAKKLYKSCMNESRIEEVGTQPLLERLNALGGWPVLEGDQWQGEDDYLWSEKMPLSTQMGFSHNYIFKISVETDDRNSSKRSIYLDQPSLGLNREYLIKGFNDTDVQHYFTYMKESAVFLGADPDRAATELELALKFELELAKLSAPREERRNATKLYNPKILGIDPRGRPTVTAGSDHCFSHKSSVRPSSLFKTKQLSSENNVRY